MRLATYLEQEAMTAAEFARRVDVSGNSVHYWLTGKKRPSLAMCQRIAQATGGQVTANDFMEDVRTTLGVSEMT